MKKVCFSSLIILLAVVNIRAQTKEQVNALSALAKSWGLLKYYHPEIARGSHNWDSVLVASTSQILQSKSKSEMTAVIDQMLAVAGKDTAKANQQVVKDVMVSRNYDMNWLNNNACLTPVQQTTLAYIAAHPYQGLNYYAQCNTENDSTVFTPNEKPYPEMRFPDVNYRLLSLFRFWNVVNYFYPYKYAIGRPWGDVLTQMIPMMVGATDTLTYRKTLARMAASINDSHGGLWPQVYKYLAGPYSPTFNFRLVGGKAVVTRIADSVVALNPGLKPGAVIETIDGISIITKIKAYWDYVPASNSSVKLRDMYDLILNSRRKTAVISGYLPGGKKFKMGIALRERIFFKEYLDFFEMTSPVTSKIMDGNVGYVYFSNVNKKNLDSAMAPMMHTKAIIFDMRNYPQNGTGTYRIPEYLLSKRTLYAMNTSPDFHLPGMMKYKVSNLGTAYDLVGKDNPAPYKSEVILLVDERTQSAAEWACMTRMTYSKVTVIGCQTAGADGNVTRTVLPGGYRINFSGLGIYYPNGKETQRVGIHIDVPVSYTVRDLVRHRDPVLNRALQFARNNKSN